MARRCDRPEIDAALRSLPGWSLDGEALFRELRFLDFAQAIAFVNRVAAIAEEMGHHPDIEIHYNQVRLRLSTHLAGGVTDLDLDLAARIDALG